MRLSGLKINSTKTKIIWIGSTIGSTTFSLLGINFSVDLETITDINYNLILPKVKSLIQQWNRRILTPIGRVTVVKTLILPKLNHLFISLPAPSIDKISSLNKDIFESVLKSKCDKIKRTIVTQDNLSGGLKMVNIDNFIKSLKCTWVKRLLTARNNPWFDIFLAINGNNVIKQI